MHLIRPTTTDDISLLPGIERSAGQAFAAYAHLAWLVDGDVMSVDEHARLAALGTSWVAGSQQLLGFVCAESFIQDSSQRGREQCIDLHIWELAVQVDSQGKGVGTALMRHVIDLAATRYSGLTLTTFKDVAFNAPFYERLGFSRIEDVSVEPRLAEVLAAEQAHGLPIEDRCAMRLVLDGS